MSIRSPLPPDDADPRTYLGADAAHGQHLAAQADLASDGPAPAGRRPRAMGHHRGGHSPTARHARDRVERVEGTCPPSHHTQAARPAREPGTSVVCLSASQSQAHSPRKRFTSGAQRSRMPRRVRSLLTHSIATLALSWKMGVPFTITFRRPDPGNAMAPSGSTTPSPSLRRPHQGRAPPLHHTRNADEDHHQSSSPHHRPGVRRCTHTHARTGLVQWADLQLLGHRAVTEHGGGLLLADAFSLLEGAGRSPCVDAMQRRSRQLGHLVHPLLELHDGRRWAETAGPVGPVAARLGHLSRACHRTSNRPKRRFSTSSSSNGTTAAEQLRLLLTRQGA